MQRRAFLKATAALSSAALLPTVASAAPRPQTLVLIELNGGNDGLNTVVPYADPLYRAKRKHLAVARDQIIKLDEHLGLHPSLQPLMQPWAAGELGIVLGVGYERPNRSHFRSIEIWDTASTSSAYLDNGWVAQVFAAAQPVGNYAADAIVLGRSEPGPVAGAGMRTIVMQDPQRFLREAKHLRTQSAKSSNPALAHLLGVRADIRTAADGLSRIATRAKPVAQRFPRTAIGKQLEQAAMLIHGGAAAPVFKLTHGSFDTHAGQQRMHARLLKELAEAIAAFRQAMRSAGRWGDVLIATYAEFGRRVAVNGSGGTDHGTAAPHLLLGGRVRGGLYGAQPSLKDLDGDDLKFSVSMRDYYTSVVREWWQLPAAALPSGWRSQPLGVLSGAIPGDGSVW